MVGVFAVGGDSGATQLCVQHDQSKNEGQHKLTGVILPLVPAHLLISHRLVIVSVSMLRLRHIKKQGGERVWGWDFRHDIEDAQNKAIWFIENKIIGVQK